MFYEKRRRTRLYPNLYVMLLAPSQTGKNRAVRHALEHLEDADQQVLNEINIYSGKLTVQSIYDHLDERKRGNIWIVTPELRMSIGVGDRATDWVTHMTEFHGGGQQEDRTRGGSHKRVENMCLNWISGTNMPWLVKAVPREDMLGGFTARLCIVNAERKKKRFPPTVYPADEPYTHAWLRDYLSYLTTITAKIVEDEDAKELFEWWTMNRPDPEDELLAPTWENDAKVHQLATVLALADDFRVKITHQDMENAIILFDWLQEQLSMVLPYVARGDHAEKMDLVEKYLESQREVRQTSIMRYATNRGISREALKGILATLKDRGEVEISRGTRIGELVYKWIGKEVENSD